MVAELGALCGPSVVKLAYSFVGGRIPVRAMPSHKKGLASCGHLRAGLPYKLLQDHIKSTSQRAGRLMVASSFSFTSFSGRKPRKATRDLRSRIR